MTEDQLQKAHVLKKEKQAIIIELDIWMKELTGAHKLGYLQSWNGDHAADLKTNIPDDLFLGFRAAAMNALNLRLIEIDKEFEQL
jgi:hypothetical protein